MPISAKAQPVGAIASATSRTVAGASALQSAKIGLRSSCASAGAIRSAKPLASPGGTIESTKSAPVTSAISSSTATMPASRARMRLASPRPLSDVRTAAPREYSLCPTAAPISPCATTTIVNAIVCPVRNPCSPLAGLTQAPALSCVKPRCERRFRHVDADVAQEARNAEPRGCIARPTGEDAGREGTFRQRSSARAALYERSRNRRRGDGLFLGRRARFLASAGRLHYSSRLCRRLHAEPDL